MEERKTKKNPITINGSNVKIVQEYKYLGCIISDDLSWDSHIANQIKKANKRFYHVRCLRKLNVNPKIIALFFNSVVSSVTMYAVACWFNNANEKNKADLTKISKKWKKLVSVDFHKFIDDPAIIHQN